MGKTNFVYIHNLPVASSDVKLSPPCTPSIEGSLIFIPVYGIKLRKIKYII